MLVKESVPDCTTCRIPYGDAINQPGWDGLVETESGFAHFVPKKNSCWEISVSRNPQDAATANFNKRTATTVQGERGEATFVFVTPRSRGSSGWDEPGQTAWRNARKDSGWGGTKIIDGVVLADWLREFPAIGKWLSRRMHSKRWGITALPQPSMSLPRGMNEMLSSRPSEIHTRTEDCHSSTPSLHSPNPWLFTRAGLCACARGDGRRVDVVDLVDRGAGGF